MKDCFLPIENYAIVGNCRAAGLIGTDGSLDWLCLPRFDGPSVFAALLDLENGGRFRVGPAGDGWRVERRYLGATPMLETTFRRDGDALRLVDFMPVLGEDDKRRRPWPQHQLVRTVDCLAGEVCLEVDFDPRPNYASGDPHVEDRGPLGFWCQSGAESLALLTDVPLERRRGGRAGGASETLRAGDTRAFSLTYAQGEPNVLLPLRPMVDELAASTRLWWEAWADRSTYEGEWKEAVTRSAITLKLMTYAPSGAMVAAPTTSLPETPGGIRNWDYRYCWLRDASWTLRALFGLGYRAEAAAFFEWLLTATRLSRPRVQVLYSLHGESHLPERILRHFEGYRSARPVRVGNAAHDQLQLDVYGELVAAAFEYVEHGGTLNRAEATFLAGLGNTVYQRWHEPDEGIWEARNGRRHHTYSKVMCAVALERLAELHDQGVVKVPVDAFRETVEVIRQRIEVRGYDAERGIYVGAFDSPALDAALLRAPLAGFIDPESPRMRRTFAAIQERLGRGPLLHRYEPGFDDLPGLEGAFGLVNFWAVEVQALQGATDEARRRFETMLGYANEVGLYSEEIDPETGGFLGNFPQAFTHLGLINAALTLHGLRRKPRAERGSSEAPPREAE